MKCKFAREADEIMTKMMGDQGTSTQMQHDTNGQGIGVEEGEQETREAKADRMDSDSTGSNRARTDQRTA